ncbi:DNA-binding GntR family transcriptional regulator [Kribbella aluminosa]|uniref:DNA-binding GntR family transcriptional regulator n=1 Tax=Kribbella aluminosa TaxID=416017 RepID=A0ABS4UK56_9ACTN|nr:GntR family transcriptional regulator [Kribbella aluminosa]MBP2352000.1 DNA-binding GntR family transcriptional regulator [Kribbella aluminosa]
MPLPGGDKLPIRVNAQDIAYERLRDWIVNGPLEPGENVRDTDVAEMLGVSRTPVREALIRLSQEGLVEIARGRSTRVADLQFDRAVHLYDLGGVLDAHAAEIAATTLGGPELTSLRAMVDEMADQQDVARAQELDEQFHDVYYLAAGNPVLIGYLEQLKVELRRIERAAFRDEQIRKEAYEEHLLILGALESRDPDAAREAALTNWRNSWARIKAWIEPRTGAVHAEHGRIA